VSHNKWIISFIDLFYVSASSCLIILVTIGCVGLIPNVFFGSMYVDIDVSIKACPFISRWKFAVQPYSHVTITHVVITNLLETVTF
jgi:hypothetical protein